MSNNYDNWERLVVAVLRREKDRQLALAHSRGSSITSASSSFNFGQDSPVHEQSLQLEASSSKVNETDRERLFPSATSSSAGLSRFSAAASDDTCVSGEILATPNLKIFTFAELKSATRNFRSDTVLGSGGFGTVFKGWVDSNTLSPCKVGTGMTVAIKKLNPESTLGFEEWRMPSEVNFLGRLSHPNLVKLLGYCWEDDEFLLVHEFMWRGSLANHLFRRSVAIVPLSWDIRLKIAIGGARGLAFLHASDKQVIYRDFKASNILLDANYNAKISDFGLAKLGPSEGNSHVFMGTYGYAAPEYVATGRLGVKSDVYGFGAVLLEILTGLRVLDYNRPEGQQNLVYYAKPLLPEKRKLMTIMDPRMKGQYSSKAALQTAQLILRCLEMETRKRPSMKEVVEVLEKIAAIGNPKESKTESTHSSSRLDNYCDTVSEVVRGDTEDGRANMDVGENVEVLITSPYPPEEDSDAEIPQPY